MAFSKSLQKSQPHSLSQPSREQCGSADLGQDKDQESDEKEEEDIYY